MADAPAEERPVVFSRPDLNEADFEAVLAVLRSAWLTSGHECAGLEEELAAYLGIPHVVAMSSCTAAMETVFAHLGLPQGAKVAVPTWTFVSTALAPVRCGATPVLLDVDPDTLNLSEEALVEALKVGIDAVVAVHFGGVPVAKEIHERCSEAGVPLVEDSAHALGATDHRGRVAGHGTVGSCYSFYATKNLTCGEGGALATEDPELAKFARTHRLHGLSTGSWSRYSLGGSVGYDLFAPGIKANLPDLLAALARSQLRRLDELQARRRAIVMRYRVALADCALIEMSPPAPVPGGADHLMVVVLAEGVDRANVISSMTAAGVGTSVHFRPLHTFEWFGDHAVIGPTGTAVADRLAPRVLSLPLHPGMTDGDVDRVCESLRAAVAA